MLGPISGGSAEGAAGEAAAFISGTLRDDDLDFQLALCMLLDEQPSRQDERMWRNALIDEQSACISEDLPMGSFPGAEQVYPNYFYQNEDSDLSHMTEEEQQLQYAIRVSLMEEAHALDGTILRWSRETPQAFQDSARSLAAPAPCIR